MQANTNNGDTPYAEQAALPNIWAGLDQLVGASKLMIDRPKGSSHPHFPELIYPLDYGYLAGTTTTDGSGIDIWIGSHEERQINAIVLTLDPNKRDAEIKLLSGCNPVEEQTILAFYHRSRMSAHLIRRGGEMAWLRTRRTVRQFQKIADLPRPVAEELISQIIETAAYAPSAHNRQPARFAVLKTLEARERLASALGADFMQALQADGLSPAEVEVQVARSYRRIVDAPAAVVLCLDSSQGDSYPDPARQHLEYLMGVQSCALAGGTLLLAAHAAGLTGVWMCAPLFAPQTVCKTLDLPKAWQPQALILLGYPAKDPAQRARKPLQEIAVFL